VQVEVVGDEEEVPLAVPKEDEKVPLLAPDASSVEHVAAEEKSGKLIVVTPGLRKFVKCSRPSTVTANWLASETVSPGPNWNEAVLTSAAAP
jgi:hypothetical protein